MTVFQDGEFRTETGATLGPIEVAYETWGTLNQLASNAVLVLHALTGDSHAAGVGTAPNQLPGWWEGMIGPGLAIDTTRYFVVCPNVLGGCQGTTGPSSNAPDGLPYGSRFPLITVRDQVQVERRLGELLGVPSWAAVVGGSMGGMRALEWIITAPDSVERAVVLAVGASASAEQIALSTLQIRAIKIDPNFHGGDYYRHEAGPSEGLAIARGLGQFSYRGAGELQSRFGRYAQDRNPPLEGGTYAIESYLDHHGNKLAHRFDANSYITLSQAMNHHDIGRGRGGTEAALGSVRAKVTVAGVSSDRLYPLWQQRELARFLPMEPEVTVVDSSVGHDGFLVEVESVGRIIAKALT
ncbi:MAG: homoserine O-acetyltransferase MetX [Ferrimicrobium sp.]